MTIDELKAGLREINLRHAGDPEAAHAEADDLLLRFIEGLCSPETQGQVTAIYEAIPKYYD